MGTDNMYAVYGKRRPGMKQSVVLILAGLVLMLFAACGDGSINQSCD